MKGTKIRSYAKLNLALNVIGKASSLHKIESLIAFASLNDEILIKKINSKSHKILFKGEFSQNIPRNNTVFKLLQILEEKELLKNRKFYIEINKRIPKEAGLGGGSMNAANILKYFLKKNIIKISKKEIITIAKQIGSDVFLGLNSTNSVLNSNNEIKYFTNCKKLYVLIVKPNFGCSTKEIYSKVRKFSKPKFNKPNKEMFNFDYLKKMNNSLEQIVLSRYDKLRAIKLFLENLSKPVFVRMTGSGSAMVAYFQSKRRCDYAKKQFNKKYKNYWCIASKTI
tara:strand:+ start:241 stop:1086 length:846 start_codon:yes stop_codon:yes gene_type:complete